MSYIDEENRLKWWRTLLQLYRNSKDYCFKKITMDICISINQIPYRWRRQIQRSVKSPKTKSVRIEFRTRKKCEWIIKNLQTVLKGLLIPPVTSTKHWEVRSPLLSPNTLRRTHPDSFCEASATLKPLQTRPVKRINQ